MQKGKEALCRHDVANISLCDLETLLDVAVEQNSIESSDKKRLLAFRDNPSDESWQTLK